MQKFCRSSIWVYLHCPNSWAKSVRLAWVAWEKSTGCWQGKSNSLPKILTQFMWKFPSVEWFEHLLYQHQHSLSPLYCRPLFVYAVRHLRCLECAVCYIITLPYNLSMTPAEFLEFGYRGMLLSSAPKSRFATAGLSKSASFSTQTWSCSSGCPSPSAVAAAARSARWICRYRPDRWFLACPHPPSVGSDERGSP